MGYTPHVLVVGGGPVGTGIARDFAIRGLEVTLVDEGSLARPGLGRQEGLLASGAQFAPEDQTRAKRYFRESRTIQEIASHCIAETGGLLAVQELRTLAEYHRACEACGLEVTLVDAATAREREPELTEDIAGALAVPDAAIDASLLTLALARDAADHGADIRPRTAVKDITVEDGTVERVSLAYDPEVADIEAFAQDEQTDWSDRDEPPIESVRGIAQEAERPDSQAAHRGELADDVDGERVQTADDDDGWIEGDDRVPDEETMDEFLPEDAKEEFKAMIQAWSGSDESTKEALEKFDMDSDAEGGGENADATGEGADSERTANGGEGDTGEEQSEEDQFETDGGKQIPGMGGDDESEGLPDIAESGTVEESEVEEITVDFVVNAAGATAETIAEQAGCSLPVSQTDLTILRANTDAFDTVISRPAGASPDSIAPGNRYTTINPGTETIATKPVAGSNEENANEVDERDDTDHAQEEDAIDDTHNAQEEDAIDDTDQASAPVETSPRTPGPTAEAVDAVQDGLIDLVPAIDDTRIVRAESTVRYEIEPGEGRDFAFVDHDKHHDCWGLLTVLGGSVTSHRWLAEKVVDRVCREFGIGRVCKTDSLVLPGSEDVPDLAEAVGTFGLSREVYDESKARLGSRASPVLHTETSNPVVCDSHSVTRAELRDALSDETVADADLVGAERMTMAGAGSEQGGQCAHRVAMELHPTYDLSVVEGAWKAFLAERWAGQRPVGGAQLGALARTYRLQHSTMNRGHDALETPELGRFDDGRDANPERPMCCPRVGWEP